MRSHRLVPVLVPPLGAVLIALALSGCTTDTASGTADTGASTAEESAAAETSLASGVYDGMDARAIIEQLEATPVAERPTDLIAGIRPDTLVLSDTAGLEVTLDMPADQFYLSVAPYLTQTHDCYFHSLTTCLGEMRGAAVSVQIVAADGTVLVDEETVTNDNGFVGFWLPRGIDAEIAITAADGRTVTTPIATGMEDPTCLTTMQLR